MQCPVPESPAENSFQGSEHYSQEVLCMECEEESEDKIVERVDEEQDRIHKHPLKNRKLQILYQEWASGRYSCYNKKFDEYRVEFGGGSEDYVNLNDIDRIETILL